MEVMKNAKFQLGISKIMPARSKNTLTLGYRWRYYSLQYLAIIYMYNGHYWSGIFSGKTEKMAGGCDDFLRDFRHFFRRCVIHHCLIMENKHFHRENYL